MDLTHSLYKKELHQFIKVEPEVFNFTLIWMSYTRMKFFFEDEVFLFHLGTSIQFTNKY